ncbi:uncharacterized protein LOC116030631 [Ipomoea triloba]|uniref:uncharacterized protein LOC116030631 n=1 Tax=Ipomoea triloba TaxID=35885 RepID=UPI00125DE309|nr:uncharacterized protein LOC116030631 [Ipomoea triloba]
MFVNTLGVTLGFHDAMSVSMPYFRDFKEDFDSDAVARQYWRSITNNAPYNSSNLKANLITRNALKAIRLAFVINLSGRTANRNKVYKQDLFYMWCMENEVGINMGVQARKWLQTQQKPKVQTVFIGPFVTRLCFGLGLLDRLMGERVEGCTISFSVGEFFAAELKLGDNDAPDLEASDDDDEDEEENEEEDAAQEQGPIPMDWDTTQNFHRHLHDEQMNYWREQHTWQEGHFTSISARQDVHTEDLNRMRRAVEENDRRIAALEARFDRQFQPFCDD